MGVRTVRRRQGRRVGAGRRLPLGVAAGVVLLLVLAGCGGEDGEGTAEVEAAAGAEVTDAEVAETAATEDAPPTPDPAAPSAAAEDPVDGDTGGATETTAADPADGGGSAGSGEVSPQALCDAMESSGAAELLGLEVAEYGTSDGSIGLAGCTPTVTGDALASLAIEDNANYGGATGQALLEEVQQLSDSFLGAGEVRPDLGDGGVVYPEDVDSDPGATILVLLGEDVVTLNYDGDAPVEDVVAAMEQIVAALG